MCAAVRGGSYSEKNIGSPENGQKTGSAHHGNVQEVFLRKGALS